MRTRRSGFSKVEIGVVAAILVVLAVALFPILFRRPEIREHISCINNLKQIGSAIMQYTQDYDEHYPLVARSATSNAYDNSGQDAKTVYGWADSIHVYLQDPQVYQCSKQDDAAQSRPDATQSGFTDYWYNGNMSGADMNKLLVPTRTILAGDGNDGGELTDGRYALFALPSSWLRNENSPSHRHLGNANYLLADGHVRVFKTQDISNAPINQKPSAIPIYAKIGATFSIR